VADIDPTRTAVPVGGPAVPGSATALSGGAALPGAAAPARRRPRMPKLSGVGTLLALGWTVLIVLGALVVDFLPLAEARDPQFALTTRSLLPADLFTAHPLGTDRQGLDVLGG